MWQTKNNQLHRQFIFGNFEEAFKFMTLVANAAEALQHHPKWTNEYNKVDIWLTTHSAGGITQKDHKLAKEIDKIYEDTKV